MAKRKKRVLIIGAGEAGEMVVQGMLNHPEYGYQPVVMIDDDPKKHGKFILGVKVIGDRTVISKAVKKYKIDEILIAIPSAEGYQIRGLIDYCKDAKVDFKIVPGIMEIIKGDVKISQIREVHPEDLLGRETVEINLDEVAGYLSGKRILITGAGGSIGGELARQVLRFQPEALILYEQDESGVYEIKLELEDKTTECQLLSVVGDIRDRNKVDWCFKNFKPQVVFHAAAYKHVPLMEENPEEAVRVNIFGTKMIATASVENKVEKFVMISTDKAVNPVNVLGATKRVAEFLVQVFSQEESCFTKFMSVRFGNVLASRGSVVPLFKKQIEAGGPVTVTHPDIVRYFMTIPEAAQLVIQAGALGEGGEIFVLDMGEPVKILQLARDLITLSGFEPEVDIQIEFIGLRPGEKLYEELLTAQEGVTKTRHEKIFIARQTYVDKSRLEENLKDLERLLKKIDRDGILKKLKEMVPNYNPNRDSLVLLN